MNLHVVQDDHPRAHLIDSVDEAAELMRWLSTKKKIAFDTETTGLDHDTDRARMAQVGDDRDGWAIPFERWAGVVDEIVAKFEGDYVMHNATFDYAMMLNGDVHIPKHKIHDTRLKAHVLWSTGSLALKPLCERLVGPWAAAAQQGLNVGVGRGGGWTWETVPTDWEQYWIYAAFDTILTYRLDEILDPQVRATAPLSYELEMAVSWVCEKMARRGVRVDRQYTQHFHEQMTEYVAAVEAWCLEHFNVKPGSNGAVADRLESLGVVFTKYTPGGSISLDKEVLSKLDHPLAQAVLGRRQAQKIASTYLRHYIEMSERDGRVHPSINTVGGAAKNPFESGGERGVRTGRMSMDEPNLQNVPVRTKEGKKIRNCFVSSEDHTWIKCDFDQIEMRLFAHLSQDPGLVALFHSGVDPFVQATRDIFQDFTIEKSDDRRQWVKNSFYAKLYGAGVEQFARTAKILTADGLLDLPVAQAFLTQLDSRYPGIRRLQRQIETDAITRRETTGDAYVESPLTQRRHVADEGREYALMNYVVQGTAGEILKMKMLECDAAGLGEFMILPVHDEIDLDVPNAQLDDVLLTLNDVMNDKDLLDVPVTSTVSIGTRWGDMKDIEP